MPRAIEVAAELRKLADALEKGGDAKMKKPTLYFYCDSTTVQEFKNAAKLLPRPLAKGIQDEDDPKWCRVRLEYNSASLDVEASIPRAATCRIIEPAKPAVYDCEPLLSDAEEAVLTA